MENFNAYVLIQTQPQKTQECWKALQDIPYVKKAHLTAGRYDVVLYLEANEEKQLYNSIVDRIRKIDGIQYSETLFAPQSFQQ